MARRFTLQKTEIPPRRSPYVGPNAFREEDKDLFCGRDHEAEHLLAVTVAEQIVVFCAQSGAGKTSLVNTRLIPGLKQKGFHVFPPARVGHKVPSEIAPDNVYVFSALGALAEKRKPRPDDTLDGFLKDYRAGEPEDAPPRVLILDQFEELLTAHPEHWNQREAFFPQLRRALQDDPFLSVLLVMREDRIAGLDRYAAAIPGGLRVRFRMERLRVEDAVVAIRKPAELAGRPFDEGVAEQLAKDLSQIRIAEQDKTIPGEFVEPVQLQVVCLQLWENLREQPGDTITAGDLEKFGNIGEALEAFYEDAVKKAAQRSKVPRGTIRNWCGTALITPAGIRSQVSRQAKTTGDLPNEAVDALVEAHLLRPEVARGGTWYELAHDRLVEPVLSSNQKWLGTDRSPLAKDARAWQSFDRDPTFLYQGRRLREALASQEPQGELEKEFLNAAREWETELRRAANRRKNLLIACLALALLCVGLLAFTACRENRISSSRALAFAAMNAIESDPPLGLTLALKAVGRDENSAAEAALHQGLEATTLHEVWSIPLVDLVALSPDGRRLATAGVDGGLTVWDPQSRREVPFRLPSAAQDLTALGFDRDGRRLAVGDRDGRVTVASLAAPPLEIALGKDAVTAVVFSPDGRRLAVAASNATPILVDLTSREQLALAGHTDVVCCVTFSLDGRYVATAGDDGQAILWDALSGRLIARFGEAEPLVSLALSSQGRLATFTQSGSVSLRDLEPGGEGSRISSLKSPVVKAAFSPDGKYLAAIDFEGIFHVWDAGSGEPLFSSIRGHRTSSASFSADLRHLVTGEASVLTENTGGPAKLWQLDGLFAPPVASGTVASMVLRADGTLVLAAQGAERVVWNPASSPVRSMSRCAAQDEGLVLSADGSSLACIGTGGDVEVWSEAGAAGRRLATIQASPEAGHFDLSPDGRILAVTSGGTAHVWDIASGRSLAALETETIQSLKLTSGMLATGHIDGTIRLWDIASRSMKPLQQKPPIEISVAAIAISPDAERLAALYVDGSVRIWEIDAAKPSALLLPPGPRILAVAFSADGGRLATANDERTVTLWDAKTGIDLFRLHTYLQPVAAFAFHPDGRSLAVALKDGTVSIEPLDIKGLQRLAQGRSRPLSDPEKKKFRLE